MANSPHFLGYSRLGAEMTKGAVDQREQFDIATPLEDRWKPGDPEYIRLWGPSQVRLLASLRPSSPHHSYPGLLGGRAVPTWYQVVLVSNVVRWVIPLY